MSWYCNYIEARLHDVLYFCRFIQGIFFARETITEISIPLKQIYNLGEIRFFMKLVLILISSYMLTFLRWEFMNVVNVFNIV